MTPAEQNPASDSDKMAAQQARARLAALAQSDGTLFDGMMKIVSALGRGGFRALLWHQPPLGRKSGGLAGYSPALAISLPFK